MVNEGDFVLVHYTGSFDDGEVFDTSLDREPLEFQVGSGSVIPGFEKAVLGMKIDEERKIVLKPEDAYGDYDGSMVHSFPLAEVKSQFEPEVGMTIGVMLDNGAQAPAVITEITEEDVKVDMNHPLAGKTLHFQMKLVEINSEAKQNHGCDGGSCGSGCSC